MERTVPSTASEEVALYLRTCYSLLRSTADVQIRTLEEAHSGMKSLLHPAAREQAPDMAALIYSTLRLPSCIHQVQLVVLGQSTEVFGMHGFPAIEKWEQVSALARRRRSFYDGQDTLACFIASRSDIEDIIPVLTAYQIEWNKIHNLLQRFAPNRMNSRFVDIERRIGAQQELADALQISLDDLSRLRTIWGRDFVSVLERIAAAPRRLRVRLLSGSLSSYRRATAMWWEQIERAAPDLLRRPVYFVSSNTHSLANLLTGHAIRQREALLEFLEKPGNEDLLNEWNTIQTQQGAGSEQNFLYYVLKKFQAAQADQPWVAQQRQAEKDGGVHRVSSEHSFDLDAQVIEIGRLRPENLDPRLCAEDLDSLAKSDALILNIDYPLGLAAYNILTEVAEQVGRVLGVYVMGKAASLNGAVGDIVIPNVVHDEHSQNTYLFSNCFTASNVAPYLSYGTVLDNQKAVTVRGTFLQNTHYMDVFYREGYTDIEMEAGPYLSAVHEMYRPVRHPVNEIVNLYALPFDLGIIHYVSDTPLSKGRNLGAGSLSYYGMDSTYAASVAVLRRILVKEQERLQNC